MQQEKLHFVVTKQDFRKERSAGGIGTMTSARRRYGQCRQNSGAAATPDLPLAKQWRVPRRPSPQCLSRRAQSRDVGKFLKFCWCTGRESFFIWFGTPFFLSSVPILRAPRTISEKENLETSLLMIIPDFIHGLWPSLFNL